jgi:uncharacterized coiled-coil protein SlyX
MAADYAALEARVAELEQQIRHILPAKMDAMNFGISVLHDELRALREDTSARFDRLEARFGDQETRLDRHGEMLQEILRRLPG